MQVSGLRLRPGVREAQSKDFGVIATAEGWNLYLGGNGGMTPRHADLFAKDLDHDTLNPHH